MGLAARTAEPGIHGQSPPPPRGPRSPQARRRVRFVFTAVSPKTTTRSGSLAMAGDGWRWLADDVHPSLRAAFLLWRRDARQHPATFPVCEAKTLEKPGCGRVMNGDIGRMSQPIPRFKKGETKVLGHQAVEEITMRSRLSGSEWPTHRCNSLTQATHLGAHLPPVAAEPCRRRAASRPVNPSPINRAKRLGVSFGKAAGMK